LRRCSIFAATSSFVAIAAKNFPLFVSMIFSLIITLTIIGVTIWKRRSASLA